MLVLQRSGVPEQKPVNMSTIPKALHKQRVAGQALPKALHKQRVAGQAPRGPCHRAS